MYESEVILNFNEHIMNVKTDIIIHFQRLIEKLTKKREQHLRFVEALAEESRMRLRSSEEDILQLQNLKVIVDEKTKENVKKVLKEKIYGFIDQTKARIDTNLLISFDWNNALEDEFVMNIGKVIEEINNEIPETIQQPKINIKPPPLPPKIPSIGPGDARNYIFNDPQTGLKIEKQKLKKKLSNFKIGGNLGSGPGCLNEPRGVAYVLSSNKICVADSMNNRVVVFNKDGEYKQTISDGPMGSPYGVCIYNSNLYVTQNSLHCVTRHELRDGTCIKRLGTKGYGKCQFNGPKGLTVDNEGNIYVCDYSNHRIQVFNEYLEFTKYFPSSKTQYPCDVIAYNELIVILDQQNPCVHMCNRSGNVIREVINFGENDIIVNPVFMCQGFKDHIFISDIGKHCIHVFDSKATFLLSFGQQGECIGTFKKPFGIAMGDRGNLVSVCCREINQLQILDITNIVN